MNIKKYMEKQNGKKVGYLYQLISLITLLEEGDEIDFGLMKIRKLKKTDSGYQFDIQVEDYMLKDLMAYYNICK